MSPTADDGVARPPSEILSDFLEQHPLYAPLRFKVSKRASLDLEEPQAWPDAITLTCKPCGRETTWTRADRSDRSDARERYAAAPHVFYADNYVIRYTCARCSNVQAAFWCAVTVSGEGTEYCVRKQGQSPAWSVAPAATIAKALPPDTIEFYQKGLICMSQNFGLAAVAYFRRVVEQVTGHLLDLIEDNAKQVGDQGTIDSITEARKAFPATERLRHAGTVLPPTLRVGGGNPLAKLYDKYSEGIHSLTDEACLDVTREIRAILDYLLPTLHEQLAAAREYQSAMAKTKPRK